MAANGATSPERALRRATRSDGSPRRYARHLQSQSNESLGNHQSQESVSEYDRAVPSYALVRFSDLTEGIPAIMRARWGSAFCNHRAAVRSRNAAKPRCFGPIFHHRFTRRAELRMLAVWKRGIRAFCDIAIGREGERLVQSHNAVDSKRPRPRRLSRRGRASSCQ